MALNQMLLTLVVEGGVANDKYMPGTIEWLTDKVVDSSLQEKLSTIDSHEL